MKLTTRLVLLAAYAALAGCTAMVQEEARKTARQSCAKDGKRFLETEKLDDGGIFGTAGVKGECVEPNDPRLEQAGSPPPI